MLPSRQVPIVVHARVSAEACTVNAPSSTAITVRHAPEQAIEAPIAKALVSNPAAMVSSASSPALDPPHPPQIGDDAGKHADRLRGRPPIYQPPFAAARLPCAT